MHAVTCSLFAASATERYTCANIKKMFYIIFHAHLLTVEMLTGWIDAPSTSAGISLAATAAAGTPESFMRDMQ